MAGSCSQLKLLFVLICTSIKSSLGDSNTIDHLQVLVYHGERYPVLPVPELGNVKPGTLTPRGIFQSEEFGRKLRSNYPEFFTRNPVPRLLAVDTSRCIDTAIHIFHGLQMKGFPEVEVLPRGDMSLVNAGKLQIKVDNIKNPALPSCLAAARDAVVEPLLKIYPANLEALFRKLVESQFSDSIDTLVQLGFNQSAFGINITSCVPPDTVLMTEDSFRLVAELCSKFFCKDLLRAVIEELQIFSRRIPRHHAASNATISVYGLTGVSLFDFLFAILPKFHHTRPKLGAFIILETRGDDISILTGENLTGESQLMDTLNIHQSIQMLRHRVLKD